MKKTEIKTLKQKLRGIIGNPNYNSPAQRIGECAGLKIFELLDWLNGYKDLPDDRLRKIDESISEYFETN